LDIFRLIRLNGKQNAVPKADIIHRLEALLTAMRSAESEGRVALEPELREGNADSVWKRAYRHFQSYHDGEVIQELASGANPAKMELTGESVYSEDVKLLYYYRNRLNHYGFPE
jgi:hypothetical protein